VMVIDKPKGLSSHDVIYRVRRGLHLKCIGHTGTLDPFATGVLVLCIGKATRLQQFFVGGDKEYLARVRLGFATDTYDLTGKRMEAPTTVNHVQLEELEKVIGEFRGEQEQVPPMFSAKKKDGVKLYRLARRGEVVERQPIKVIIHEIELLDENGRKIIANPDGTADVTLRVKCSAGTYIRTLAHDIGQRLGCGAHLVDLRRTAAGEFRIEAAIGLEAFEQLAKEGKAPELIIPLSRLLTEMPQITLSEEEAWRITHGQGLRRIAPTEGKYVRLVDAQGRLVAVGENLQGSGFIQPRVVLDSETRS
ncbi:MAG: tRNA pseudouridine(55) synthase TruB, partial [candidate division WOR-3 bacterium]